MENGEIFIERRKYKRIEYKTDVKYKIISSPEEIEKIKKELRDTKSVNIGGGGIQLVEDIKLYPEQILRLEFKIEDKEDPVITFAEVKWCFYDEKLQKYRSGIEFFAIKEEDRRIILKMTNDDLK